MQGFRVGGVRIRVRRRGRWLLAVVLAALVVLGVPRIFAARAGEPGDGLVTVVVSAGDTLWDLAEAHGPQGADPRVTVDRIQRLNSLSTPLIRPGQRLLIPTR
ncbi:MAG TPA: LysM peptidoglycan-binding domain-containing protein [Bacillota bacterium]